MEILSENSALLDISKLDALWAGKSTFLIVPEKHRANDQWLAHAMALVPKSYRAGCFGLLTSGSTGSPKLILGNKARSEKLALLLHNLQDSEPVAEAICTLPLSYSYSFINQWLWAYVMGRKLRLTAGFSQPDSVLEALTKARNAMLCLVGSQVALLRRYFPDSTFSGILRLHFAGGRFPQEQLGFLQARFPNARIFNNYGCAEAMPRLTLRRAEDAPAANHIGHTLPGVEMRADKDKRLLFRSPYRAVAYVDDEGFHPVADDEWVPTGDLGEQLEDGSWRLLGRANEVFKRFGEKISLPQLLTTVKGSWDGDAAFYQEIDPAGEQGCILVLSPEPAPQQVRDILMGFRKHHTRPHWPLRIESVAQLPLLPNGKPDIAGLQDAQEKQLHWRQRI
ncbi:MAG: AMP-binding protein [Xanthomonadales bacterium]|nr:AMP-binding protein [Xanthomonadales bacterium]